jgi:hypothetical protein
MITQVIAKLPGSRAVVRVRDPGNSGLEGTGYSEGGLRSVRGTNDSGDSILDEGGILEVDI